MYGGLSISSYLAIVHRINARKKLTIPIDETRKFHEEISTFGGRELRPWALKGTASSSNSSVHIVARCPRESGDVFLCAVSEVSPDLLTEITAEGYARGIDDCECISGCCYELIIDEKSGWLRILNPIGQGDLEG